MISIPNFFFEILQRYCKLVWVIWKHLIMPINNDNISLVGNFDSQSVEISFLETLHAKNQLQL